MKIIRVDNFNRETVSDSLVCENVNDYYGREIETFLNTSEKFGDDSFFKLVPDDYKLYKFEP